jgi:hypothetical protein
VSKFYSIPKHPSASEYYASRESTSHDTTGFTEGDQVMYQGDCAIVLGEERDSHSGEVTVYMQKSEHGRSGLVKAVWAPSGERGMVLRDRRRTV